MLGILFAVKKWKQYPLGREFIIKTDHKPLRYLLEQRLYTEAHRTWLFKLHRYKFVVVYKKGKKNVATDSLSRKEDDEGTFVLTIIIVKTDYLGQLKAMIDSDVYFQGLNSKLEDGTLDLSKYQKREELFFYKRIGF